ncbi:MAG: hypothetical protein IPJ19_17415 [Planctomycetes bacterium]|nr:hypothetical protein [Planctomycetota bacterium]
MTPRPRRIREELLVHGAWLVPLVACLWLRQFALPLAPVGPNSQESAGALEAWRLLHPLRLGVESFDAAGYLGWLRDGPAQDALFAWRLWGFEFAFKGLLCALCAFAVLRARGAFARVLFAAALLALPAGFDALAFVALLVAFRAVLGEPAPSARAETAWLLLAALLTQFGFAFCAVWAAGLALAGLARALDCGGRSAAALLARGLGALLFVWLLAGQSPAGLPAWARSSWWMAQGADEAGRGASGLALGTFAALACALVLARAAPARGARRHALLVLALGTAFVAWRSGSLREPPGAARAITLAPIAALAHPGELRVRLALREQAVADEWKLPLTRVRSAGATLDVFGNGQEVALFNGLEYHPRPAAQSRAASTPELLERNRAFFAGADAPHYVLARLDASDGHLAAAEDAPAFAELLLRYRLCFEERGWLLLEHRAEPVRENGRSALPSRAVRFGEWIDLDREPGEALEVRLDARLSASGVLQALCLRQPQLECEFERADGSLGRARLARGAACAGFLVRPFVATQLELRRLFLGERVAGLRRLRLVAPEGEAARGCESAELALVRHEGLLPAREEQVLHGLEFPYLVPPPLDSASAESVRDAQEQGRLVHVFTAPAVMRWRLEPGHYRLRGNYGMLDESWQSDPATDGALVFVVLQQGRELDQVFRRFLEPAKTPEDRGFIPMDLGIVVRETGDLQVRMRTGWVGDATRDWVFWESLRIERE